jgi:hypothetical protein
MCGGDKVPLVACRVKLCHMAPEIAMAAELLATDGARKPAGTTSSRTRPAGGRGREGAACGTHACVCSGCDDEGARWGSVVWRYLFFKRSRASGGYVLSVGVSAAIIRGHAPAPSSRRDKRVQRSRRRKDLMCKSGCPCLARFKRYCQPCGAADRADATWPFYSSSQRVFLAGWQSRPRLASEYEKFTRLNKICRITILPTRLLFRECLFFVGFEESPWMFVVTAD